MSQEVGVQSREEDEELQRSTKKVKEFHRLGGHQDSSPLSPMSGGASYKARLLREVAGAYEQAFEFNSDMDMGAKSNDEVSDLSVAIGAVNLFGERKQNIWKQWKNAFIVKIVGRIVGFQFLQSRLMSMWKPGGRMDVVPIGKDFYLVKFSLREDYANVLKGGPWFVGGHYLSIRN